MFTQLDPPIPFDVENMGEGLAIAVVDYGPDYDLRWVIILNKGGEVWTVPNGKVRGVQNYTMGRTRP